jgi:hypothetical protein
MWVDENAFGLLISYFAVEDDEYALEREAFVERFEAFRLAVYDFAALDALGEHVRALDLGHAVYFEVAAGDESTDVLAWMKRLRTQLSDAGFDSVGVITHGSRWVPEEERFEAHTQAVGTSEVTAWSRPSEPLRRAFYADAKSRPSGGDDEAEDGGWGPGLYFDTEAVEALGRTPKNAPTALEFAGASFYRAGR